MINCGINPVNSIHLTTFLSVSTITDLALDYNPLGSKGVSNILNGILDNKLYSSTAFKLSMNSCQGGVDALSSLSLILSHNYMLT